MLSLIFMAVIGGSILNWLIFSSFYLICVPLFLKNLILFVCILGGIFGLILNFFNFYFLNKSLRFYFFRSLNFGMWFIPFLSTFGVIFYPLNYGQIIVKIFDIGWLEFFGGQNFKLNFINFYSFVIQIFQNNNLKIYLLFILFWVILLFIFIF
jgi:NADH-ubiquinone oxidoreductase chain 5